MNKTIAQQLNIKDFPFIIRDKQGNEIYYENFNGYSYKKEYDSEGNRIYFEDNVIQVNIGINTNTKVIGYITKILVV